jgi:divalent metal cation (Fe/Co/Zn/Cd) transporter
MKEAHIHLDSTFPTPNAAEESKELDIIHACWIAFWLSIAIAFLKITSGLLGYGPLLIIDGLTSGAIAVVVTTTVLGIQMSDTSAVSKSFYYSRGKIQFLAELFVGVALGISGITYWAIGIKSLGTATVSDDLAIGVSIVIIAILGSLIIIYLFRHIRLIYKIPHFRNLERLQKLSILASIMVFISYFFLAFGWVAGDRIARFSLCLIVNIISFFIISAALNGLTDRSAGKEIEERIRSLAITVDHVEKVNWVRTRRVGNKLYAEIKIEMDRSRKVSEFDQATGRIKEMLREHLEEQIRVVNVEYCIAN